MQYVQLVALLALFQYLGFIILTGRARGKSGLKAPTMTGDPGFERMYRVQMNTLETLVVFLPALYLASLYWPATWVAALGAVYLVGRMLYWRAYVADPSTRAVGYSLSLLPTLILMILALVGIFMGKM
jgi:glutathione S-transferase